MTKACLSGTSAAGWRSATWYGLRRAVQRMPSTVIRSFDYRDASQELRVMFRSGRCYVYKDVPREVYDAMKSAFAKGEFFNTHIRSRFAFERQPPH
jgi:lysyl-tRNA synthetase class 2